MQLHLGCSFINSVFPSDIWICHIRLVSTKFAAFLAFWKAANIQVGPAFQDDMEVFYNSRLQYFQTFVLALLCTSMPNQGAILHVKHPVHMYDKPLAIRHTSWLLGGKAAYAHCLFLCNLSRYQRQVVLRRDRKSDSGLRCMEAMLRTRTRTTKTETDKHTLTIFDSVHSSIPRRARWAWVATSCSASNNFRAFNAWAPSAKEHGTTFGLDIIPLWCDMYIYKYIRII